MDFITLTMVCILFVVLWTYGQRSQYSKTEFRSKVYRKAWSWFLTGFICLIVYKGMHEAILMNIYSGVGLTHGDSGRFLGDILLLALYSSFFAFLTRAFVMLAMNEYSRSKE